MKLRHHRFLFSTLLLVICFSLSSCSAAGFVPKSDTTWGELYRHFDSEEFSELDPQLQQMMDEAVLSQEVAENEAQPLTEVGSVAPIYPEEDAEEIEPVLDQAVFSFAKGTLSDEGSITQESSSSTFNVVSYPLPEEDGIRVDSYFYCPEKCPSICLVVFLQDPESGECVAFSSSDDFYYHEGLARPPACATWRKILPALKAAAHTPSRPAPLSSRRRAEPSKARCTPRQALQPYKLPL